MSTLFYLVQRLARTDRDYKTGFDAKFDCDYMGSSEFEFGAIPASLKRMRANARNLVLTSGTVTRNGSEVTVYFVSDQRVATDLPATMTEWMSASVPRGQELTRFPEQVEGNADNFYTRTNAWWDIKNDVMWALDAGIATDLLDAVRG